MATCPRCHGFLDDDHVCQGRGARVLGAVVRTTVACALGGLAGAFLFQGLGDLLGLEQMEAFGLVAGVVAAAVVTYSLRPR